MICRGHFGSTLRASVILWKLIWETEENRLKCTLSKPRDMWYPKIFTGYKSLFRWGLHVIGIVSLIVHTWNAASWKPISYCRSNRQSQGRATDHAQRTGSIKKPAAKSQFDSHYALDISIGSRAYLCSDTLPLSQYRAMQLKTPFKWASQRRLRESTASIV